MSPLVAAQRSKTTVPSQMDTSTAVETTLTAPINTQTDQEPTPTTPKARTGPFQDLPQDATVRDSSPNTPASHSIDGDSRHTPLPDGPMTPINTSTKRSTPFDSLESLDTSPRSIQSTDGGEPQDVEMGDALDSNNGGADDGSEDESVTSESQRPSKKKKGQRFFCTEFPPCQLSFTRSEHLARHIRYVRAVHHVQGKLLTLCSSRKHTGERPFQCHCSRRFSRLDNLRQHAQTVHVNEDIPLDSLAAQSTRFQRQIRTDRVRPTGSRSRASTIGSQGPHSRGHSRNLSTSSIGSTASSVGVLEEGRRRPPPLAMANDASARARLSLETLNTLSGNSNHQYHYYNQSPTGYSTPTSATFSTETGSPQYQSGMVSPVSTLSRSSFYNGSRAPGRRLSVPSVSYPYLAQNPATYPPVYFSPLQSGSPSTYSQNTNTFASPTSSVYSHSRRDSETDMEYRRRTWHPSTNSQFMQRPATSGLTYHQTPDEPRPAFSQQPAASQMTRLPGIESFDYALPSGSRQPPSPMMTDASPQPNRSGYMPEPGPHQGPARLDIAVANEGQWQVQSSNAPPGYFTQPGPGPNTQYGQPQQVPMPESPVTPRNKKRNAWYGGPLAPSQPVQGHHVIMRTSPEDSGSSDGVPTPSTSQSSEVHPIIVNPNGMGEAYPTGSMVTEEQKVTTLSFPRITKLCHIMLKYLF